MAEKVIVRGLTNKPLIILPKGEGHRRVSGSETATRKLRRMAKKLLPRRGLR